MSRIALLNPNTTDAVTRLLLETARSFASPSTELVPLTAPRGFPYLATRAEAQIGGTIVLEMLADIPDPIDAAIIAAFGDPGLFGARELFDFPVIGVSEAAMLTACMLGKRFALVTFAQVLRPWFRDCVDQHGLSHRCAGIVALDSRFTALDVVQDELTDHLVRLAEDTVANEGADVLIFAGAPLAGLAGRVAGRLPVPLVDPISAAVKQAELLTALKPRKATRGAFARPAAKVSTGLSVALANRLGHIDA